MQVETLLVLDPASASGSLFQFERCVFRQGVPLDLGRGFAFDAVFQSPGELVEVFENASRPALVVHVCAQFEEFAAALAALPRDRTRVLEFEGASPKPKQLKSAIFEERGPGAAQNETDASETLKCVKNPKNSDLLLEHTTRTGNHLLHVRLDPADRRFGLALAQIARGEPPCARSGLLRYLREHFQTERIQNLVGVANAGAELQLGLNSAWTTLRALAGLRPNSRLPTAPAAAPDDWALVDALSL